ncbi:hypothetical protein [Streptomyces lateritius]|uniref:hypothetical protein n=1 Tax=Streptomyces lateritius TaxID=67313 RepID=UPI001C8BD17A|nr:hypothetical protein [Streptomyces lateritius]MBX9423282.1 hypothetical protein [Streptomyces lateritius]
MRTALRTAIAVALVTGVAMTPALAAGAAFAADGPVAVQPAAADAKPSVKPSATASAKPSDNLSDKPSAETVAQPAAATPATAKPSAATPSTAPAAKPTTEAAAKPAGEPVTEPASQGPKAGLPVMLGDCTTEWVIPSVFGQGWTVTLTNDLEKGPKAVLRDAEGKVHGTADRDHPFESRVGLKIEGADTRNPAFGQRTQGGVDTPFRWTAFTRLPADCHDTYPDAPAQPPVTTGDCRVEQVIDALFEGTDLSVTLINDTRKGPKAVLKDDRGAVLATVDRAHPADLKHGLVLERLGTPTPVLGERTQHGVDVPFRWTSFPKAPACDAGDSSSAPDPSASAGTGTGTQHAGQTSVIPKGGVAAGAELGTRSDSTALVAAGAGAASLAAAGLGFVVLRRRAAARA